MAQSLMFFQAYIPSSQHFCLYSQVAAIPFLATDVGGVAELLTPADRERLLVEPTPKAITNRLSEALRSGLKPAHPPTAPDFAQQSLRETWVVWHHIVLHHMQVCMNTSSEHQVRLVLWGCQNFYLQAL